MDQIENHGIREIGFSTVTEQESASSIEGFFNHAFKKMRDKTNVCNKRVKSIIEYNGIDSSRKISLYLIRDNSGIDVYRCVIQSTISDLNPLYNVMDGLVRLEFCGLRFGEESRLWQELKSNRDDDRSHSNNWKFYFEGKSDIIKAAELQKTVGFFIWKDRVSARLDEVILSPEERALMSRAERIEINGNFFQDKNKGTLLNERWIITHPEDKKYFWKYEIRATRDRSLPAPIFFDLSRVFDLAKSGFSADSFNNVAIKQIDEEVLYDSG